MFYNLRYITLLVYGLITVLALIAGTYFKYYTTNHVIKISNQREARELASNYVKIIWNRYYPVIGFLNDKSYNIYHTFPQFLSLVDENNKFFASDKLLKAVIHNDNGIIYESNSDNFKEKQSIIKSWFESDRVGKALKLAKDTKKTVTIILPSTVIEGKDTRPFALVKSFIPIAAHGDVPELKNFADKANAILEINYNIDPEFRKIETIQFTAVFFIILAFGALSVVMFIAAQKAEKTIEKQQEASAELAAAKASAEAENKEKSKFLANVSHELRTPLNAIIGFSEIISTESMGPINNDQYKEFIKDIHTSGLHLLSLINDILDFSKAEEDKLEVLFEDVDLTKVIKVSLRMVLPRAEQAKVSLKDDLPEEHLIMRADGKRIKQVLLNLLSNSVKFTPEGGSVSLKSWKNVDLNTIIIEISDTGVGMEPQDIAKALAPFGQVDNKLSRRYEGTGLGLPLTKKLVELMKGKFEIKSEVGIGTTITLSFPLPQISPTEATNI